MCWASALWTAPHDCNQVCVLELPCAMPAGYMGRSPGSIDYVSCAQGLSAPCRRYRPTAIGPDMRHDTVFDHLNAEIRDTLQHRQRQPMPIQCPAVATQSRDSHERLSTRRAPAAHDVFEPCGLDRDLGQAPTARRYPTHHVPEVRRVRLRRRRHYLRQERQRHVRPDQSRQPALPDRRRQSKRPSLRLRHGRSADRRVLRSRFPGFYPARGLRPWPPELLFLRVSD